jgi:hypothetical protein
MISARRPPSVAFRPLSFLRRTRHLADLLRRSALVSLGGLAISSASAGCSATPPAHFQEGGATLALGRARWSLDGDHVMDVMPDGRVLFDGEPRWELDAKGRIRDRSGDPLALLRADGVLLGDEDNSLGIVGTQTASAPGATTAWLLLQPNGHVIAFDQEGAAYDGARWQGCEGPMGRTCLLVTHLTRLAAANGPRTSVGLGFGIGFGVGGRR